jgi:hypothetical protein
MHAHGPPRGSIPYLLLAGSCVHTQRTSPTSTCTVRITTHLHSHIIAFEAAPPAPLPYIYMLSRRLLRLLSTYASWTAYCCPHFFSTLRQIFLTSLTRRNEDFRATVKSNFSLHFIFNTVHLFVIFICPSRSGSSDQ